MEAIHEYFITVLIANWILIVCHSHDLTIIITQITVQAICIELSEN